MESGRGGVELMERYHQVGDRMGSRAVVVMVGA